MSMLLKLNSLVWIVLWFILISMVESVETMMLSMFVKFSYVLLMNIVMRIVRFVMGLFMK